MAQDEGDTPTTEATTLPPPVVFTLATDHTFNSHAEMIAACYSWSKDGGAPSTAQWVLSDHRQVLTVNWLLDAAGTTQPPSTEGKPAFYDTALGGALGSGGSVPWAADGDGTYSAIYPTTGTWNWTPPRAVDLRGKADAAPATAFPITIKAGTTVTATPSLEAAPTVHTVSNISPDSFRVNWSTQGNRDIEIDGVVAHTNQNSGKYLLGLTPGTAYSVRTRSVASGTRPESEWTAAVVTTTAALPVAPAVHTITGITASSFTVNWTTAPARDIEINGTVEFSGSSKPKTVTGRTPTTQYSVRTRTATPRSEWTAPVVVTTIAQLANPVLTVTPTEDSVTVEWPAVPNATSYDIRFYEATTGAQVDRTDIASPQTISGLPPDTAITGYVLAKAAGYSNGGTNYSTRTLAVVVPPYEPSFPLPERVTPPAIEYTAPLANPLPSGLYTTATGPLPLPAHWGNGIRLTPINCATASGTWDVDPCADPGDARKEGLRGDVGPPFLPVAAWGFDQCDLWEPDADMLARARQQQRLGEQLAVETAFAARVVDEATALPAAESLIEAVGALEEALAVFGVAGVIHAAPKWAAVAAHEGQIRPGNSAVLRTTLGHAWAFGGGYADLDNTLVATGPVTLWSGELEEHLAPDPMSNTKIAVVERVVIVGYECFAARVDITVV
jgi:hypothetical protein